MKAIDKVKIICNAIDDKKGEDIKVIDIHEISIIADYFVIASAGNSSQMQALVDNIDEELGKQKVSPKSIEGGRDSSWILMDFGDVIVHLFPQEERIFYDLERIWRDGKVLEVSNL